MKNFRSKIYHLVVFLTIIFSAWLASFSGQAFAQTQAQLVEVHLFTTATCPHCREEKAFFQEVLSGRSDFEVYNYDIANRRNAQLLTQVTQELGAPTGGVPVTVIGDELLVGFDRAETTGVRLLELIEQEIADPSDFSVTQLAAEAEIEPVRSQLQSEQASRQKRGLSEDVNLTIDSVSLPLIGQVQLKELSLPLLTFVLAFLDGFNPCAMWVLLFLITLLLGMEDKKRMWLLGGVFILSSGFVYFLFMSAWLQFFLFVGYVNWVRILIGLIAIGTAGYYLYDYQVNKLGACKTDLGGKKQKIFAKLKDVAYRPQLWLAVLGMIGLAFAVNLVELVCSAGLPAVYTQVLSLSNLPTWQYYLYLGFYILVFMLDDLAVFIIAMTTLNKVGLNTKYARVSHLVGGLLMLLIGLALLFKPELLMFG